MTHCKCGAKRAVKFIEGERRTLPACWRCWNDFLYDQGPTVYTPRQDGLKVPVEATLEWQLEQAEARPLNPFGQEAPQVEEEDDSEVMP